MDSIRLITTGGTIDEDREDPQTHKSLFTHTQLPIMLDQGRVKAHVVLEEVLRKDSRDVTSEDRVAILQSCEEAAENKILIAHGTFTMEDTAKLLGPKISGKTIVLFGAAVPFKKEFSDAHFNLGYAFAAVQSLPAGVYIAMNGKTFPWDNVRKNTETGIFESVEAGK